MPRDVSEHWWDKYLVKCPSCKSSKVVSLNLFKYTFRKDKNEEEKYKCTRCGHEFWRKLGFL